MILDSPRPRFTADFHLSHVGILRHVHQRRVWWKYAESMKVELLLMWERGDVGPVIHLGDFALCSKEPFADLLREFVSADRPGCFMEGNHDKRALRKLGITRRGDGTFAANQVAHAHGLPDPFELTLDGIDLYMTHRPLDDWPGKDDWAGVIHLHGHSHGKAPCMAGRIDVGVDVFQRILTWEEVRDIILVNRRERATTR